MGWRISSVAMVLIFVGLVVMVGVVSGQQRLVASSSRSRCRVHSEVTALIKKAKCRPVDQPVPVPVPEGYAYVAPSVVMVPQCVKGMACFSSVLSCMPLQQHIRNITIPVYAYTHRRERVCTSVEVEIHEGCDCGCTMTCPNNQVMSRDMCGCECDGESQRVCEGRQRLWDPSACSCLCPLGTPPTCSSGQVYIQELCRCENY